MAGHNGSVSGSHARAPHQRATIRDAGRLRILIVDDNRDQCVGLCEILRSWGYDVEAAHNANAALAIAADFRPRVILLDLGLPDMHGYELAKRLRATSGGRRIFFVVMTGWTQIADQISSTAAGISHHLIKPVNMDTLRYILAGYQAAETRSNAHSA
jgi:CheY-like chemotaxis protein